MRDAYAGTANIQGTEPPGFRPNLTHHSSYRTPFRRHFPDAEALARARRLYTGETSAEAARAEIDAKYSRG